MTDPSGLEEARLADASTWGPFPVESEGTVAWTPRIML